VLVGFGNSNRDFLTGHQSSTRDAKTTLLLEMRAAE
jgi:hypothetical protein